ncbi:hypothetical protein D3C80_1671420 [compost metagenome]
MLVQERIAVSGFKQLVHRIMCIEFNLIPFRVWTRHQNIGLAHSFLQKMNAAHTGAFGNSIAGFRNRHRFLKYALEHAKG